MTQTKAPSAQSGFTLIETMIAIAILSIGIVTLIAAFGTAVGATQHAEENLIAREKALQALESVYAARNDQQITSFSQIANISNGGIFTDGATPLLCAGPDGLVNTADDIDCPASGPCVAGPECVVLPGPDGILGTPDDVAMRLSNFTRQIQITAVPGYQTLNQVVVTITYTQGGTTPIQTYKVDALISAYR
jgi:prepilin-type N-terminal cleavage/methylation domain-containing protein